jgi:hypothetical protein
MSSASDRPQVGIVSDIVLQRHRLQEAASRFGLDVCFSGDPARLLAYLNFPEASLWLVTLEDEADQALFSLLAVILEKMAEAEKEELLFYLNVFKAKLLLLLGVNPESGVYPFC